MTEQTTTYEQPLLDELDSRASWHVFHISVVEKVENINFGVGKTIALVASKANEHAIGVGCMQIVRGDISPVNRDDIGVYCFVELTFIVHCTLEAAEDICDTSNCGLMFL